MALSKHGLEKQGRLLSVALGVVRMGHWSQPSVWRTQTALTGLGATGLVDSSTG